MLFLFLSCFFLRCGTAEKEAKEKQNKIIIHLHG